MKKLFIAGIFFAAFFTVSSCNKKNGCPNSSERARIRDFTSDSCTYIIQLDDDGTKLEATNLSEYPYIPMEEGQLVWVKFKPTSGASACGLGDSIVRIKCMSEREF